jgi:hypothetical protein
MLRSLDLRNVGPSDQLTIEFGDRLNVITGDSGLGKSFLLDVAWWALTRSWAAGQALPNRGAEREATLSYRIDGKTAPVEADIDFSVQRQGWFHDSGRPPISGLVVYARVDGSFTVMDPARNDPPDDEGDSPAYRRRPTAFFFNSDEVWNGLVKGEQQLCCGLIADWRVWKLQSSEEFKALENMLRGEPPAEQVTLLIDDVEAHLHPRWQRAILPAILQALQGLGASAGSQVISTTHSPLVLASLEGLWEEKHDRLFRLDLVSSNESAPHVELKQEEWRPLSRHPAKVAG